MPVRLEGAEHRNISTKQKQSNTCLYFGAPHLYESGVEPLTTNVAVLCTWLEQFCQNKTRCSASMH